MDSREINCGKSHPRLEIRENVEFSSLEEDRASLLEKKFLTILVDRGCDWGKGRGLKTIIFSYLSTLVYENLFTSD